jgi:hypothetical protein
MEEFELANGQRVRITDRALDGLDSDHHDCPFCLGRAAAHRGEGQDANPFTPIRRAYSAGSSLGVDRHRRRCRVRRRGDLLLGVLLGLVLGRPLWLAPGSLRRPGRHLPDDGTRRNDGPRRHGSGWNDGTGRDGTGRDGSGWTNGSSAIAYDDGADHAEPLAPSKWQQATNRLRRKRETRSFIHPCSASVCPDTRSPKIVASTINATPHERIIGLPGRFVRSPDDKYGCWRRGADAVRAAPRRSCM